MIYNIQRNKNIVFYENSLESELGHLGFFVLLYQLYPQILHKNEWHHHNINYAKNNLKFSKLCGSLKFDLDSGLSLDGKTKNFFQLLKNLLPGINTWDDLTNNYIEEIDNREV